MNSNACIFIKFQKWVPNIILCQSSTYYLLGFYSTFSPKSSMYLKHMLQCTLNRCYQIWQYIWEIVLKLLIPTVSHSKKKRKFQHHLKITYIYIWYMFVVFFPVLLDLSEPLSKRTAGLTLKTVNVTYKYRHSTGIWNVMQFSCLQRFWCFLWFLGIEQ